MSTALRPDRAASRLRRTPGRRAAGPLVGLRSHSIAVWVMAGLAVAFLVAPSIFVIIVSFGEGRFIRFPPSGWTTHWFEQIGSVFWSATWFSMKVAVASAVISLLLGVPAALALTRGRYRTRPLVDGLLRAPLQVPYIVMGVAFLQYYRLIGELGGPLLLGTTTGLIVAHTIVTAPFVISAAVAGLERFDRNLEDAAYGLGMGKTRTFFRITLPSIRTSLFAGAFFAFLVSFDNVPVSLYLGVADSNTLPVLMFQTAETAPSPTLYAVSTAVIVASVLAITTFNRFIGIRGAVSVG